MPETENFILLARHIINSLIFRGILQRLWMMQMLQMKDIYHCSFSQTFEVLACNYVINHIMESCSQASECRFLFCNSYKFNDIIMDLCHFLLFFNCSWALLKMELRAHPVLGTIGIVQVLVWFRPFFVSFVCPSYPSVCSEPLFLYFLSCPVHKFVSRIPLTMLEIRKNCTRT